VRAGEDPGRPSPRRAGQAAEDPAPWCGGAQTAAALWQDEPMEADPGRQDCSARKAVAGLHMRTNRGTEMMGHPSSRERRRAVGLRYRDDRNQVVTETAQPTAGRLSLKGIQTPHGGRFQPRTRPGELTEGSEGPLGLGAGRCAVPAHSAHVDCTDGPCQRGVTERPSRPTRSCSGLVPIRREARLLAGAQDSAC
jgi:hypothetical protein